MNKLGIVFLTIGILTSGFAVAQTDSRTESFALNCFASHPVQKADGTWTRETVASESKVLAFDEGTNGQINDQKITLRFKIGQAEVELNGQGALYAHVVRNDDGSVLFSIKDGTVTAMAEIPSKDLKVLFHDGLQIDMNNLGVMQGTVGSSSGTVIIGMESYTMGCSIERTLE